MCRIEVKVTCPHCLSAKVVKNGKKSTGVQHFLCRRCEKQFQYDYLYQGADPREKARMTRCLIHGSGIRDTAKICSTSTRTVIKQLIDTGKFVKTKWRPRQKRYYCVQIDDMWAFAGSKQKKGWIFYATCPQTGEILAVTMGKRSVKQLDSLMAQLRALQIEIEYYCTDGFEGFKNRFKCYKHVVGKKYTKYIEGCNTNVRAKLARLQRRSTKFSKKVECLWYLSSSPDLVYIK